MSKTLQKQAEHNDMMPHTYSEHLKGLISKNNSITVYHKRQSMLEALIKQTCGKKIHYNNVFLHSSASLRAGIMISF